jgi:hypothetical protein
MAGADTVSGQAKMFSKLIDRMEQDIARGNEMAELRKLKSEELIHAISDAPHEVLDAFILLMHGTARLRIHGYTAEDRLPAHCRAADTASMAFLHLVETLIDTGVVLTDKESQVNH